MRVSYFNKVNDEGKLEIPKEFLKKFGIKDEDKIEIIVEEDQIKLRKI